MGVEALVSRDVFEADLHPWGKVGYRLMGVVVIRLALDVGVDDSPDIVAVPVRVEGGLLFW